MRNAKVKTMTKREAERRFEELTAACEQCLAELRTLRPGKRTMPRRRVVQQRYAALGDEMRKVLDMLIA